MMPNCSNSSFLLMECQVLCGRNSTDKAFSDILCSCPYNKVVWDNQLESQIVWVQISDPSVNSRLSHLASRGLCFCSCKMGVSTSKWFSENQMRSEMLLT